MPPARQNTKDSTRSRISMSLGASIGMVDGGLEPAGSCRNRAGHANIAMTLETYGHPFPRGDDGKELAEAELRLIGHGTILQQNRLLFSENNACTHFYRMRFSQDAAESTNEVASSSPPQPGGEGKDIRPSPRHGLGKSALAQQGVRGRELAAEGAVGLARVARAARCQDIAAQ